jgi:hypothetical protein
MPHIPPNPRPFTPGPPVSQTFLLSNTQQNLIVSCPTLSESYPKSGVSLTSQEQRKFLGSLRYHTDARYCWKSLDSRSSCSLCWADRPCKSHCRLSGFWAERFFSFYFKSSWLVCVCKEKESNILIPFPLGQYFSNLSFLWSLPSFLCRHQCHIQVVDNTRRQFKLFFNIFWEQKHQVIYFCEQMHV